MANEVKLVTLIALVSLSGKFLLPYDTGMSFEIEEKQAEEMVQSGYAKYADSKKEEKAKNAKPADKDNASDKGADASEKR